MRRRSVFHAEKIGTEHILLALLKEQDCIAIRLLKGLSVNLKRDLCGYPGHVRSGCFQSAERVSAGDRTEKEPEADLHDGVVLRGSDAEGKERRP